MVYYFYKTIHLRDWSFYYGSGSKQNYFGSGKILKRKIKKYGIHEFLHIRLRYFNTREEAYNFEDRFLKLYKITTLEKCMNLKSFAEGGCVSGENHHFYKKTHSDESKLKISIAGKGRKHSDESKLKISIASRNREVSNETRKKLSEINKGRPNVNKGKKILEEHRKKISLSKSGSGHHMYDNTIYHFINNDGTEIKSTKYELIIRFNLGTGLYRLVSGERKSYKGWRIKIIK